MVNDILINKAASIDSTLADTMKRIVGFRNIAVHNYQTLLLRSAFVSAQVK